MAEFTFYELLGVTKEATDAEVKEAYKERARYYHPDVTTLPVEIAQAQLKIINEAYAALGNPEKRQAYDAELLARKELSLLGEYSDQIELLYQGKWKSAIRILREMVEKAPESDIPHGLLATAYHMQAIAAFEEQKYKLSSKLLKQALDIGFDDLSLRKAIKYDLALVEHRMRTPGPLIDLPSISLELSQSDKNRQLRALAALESGEFRSGETTETVLKLASRSLFREVRLAALKVLPILDEKHGEAYTSLLELYSPGKEAVRLALLKRFNGGVKRAKNLRALLLPFLWDSQEPVRLAVIQALRAKEYADDLSPLLWSASPAVQRAAGTALKRLDGGWLFPISKKALKAKQDALRRKGILPQLAPFWEQPSRRGELVKHWTNLKHPERMLEYVLVAFFAKTAGVAEPAREFLSAHGEAATGMLIEASKDEDWVVRLNVLQILRAFKSPEIADLFLAVLDESRAVLLKEAIEYLSEAGDARAIDPLRLLFRHEDAEIVEAAQDAVNKLRNYTPPTLKRKQEAPAG